MHLTLFQCLKVIQFNVFCSQWVINNLEYYRYSPISNNLDWSVVLATIPIIKNNTVLFVFFRNKPTNNSNQKIEKVLNKTWQTKFGKHEKKIIIPKLSVLSQQGWVIKYDHCWAVNVIYFYSNK